MTERILATYVLDFDEGEAGSLTLAIESDDNNGRTSFYPGDTIYLRLYGSPSSLLDSVSVHATNGSIIAGSVTTDTFEEDVTFTNGEGSVSHTIESASIEWYGTDLGSITYNAGVSSTIYSQIKSMGIGSVTYTAKYLPIIFSSVSGNFDPVLIWVEAT